jgi:hypothetical protein
MILKASPSMMVSVIAAFSRSRRIRPDDQRRDRKVACSLNAARDCDADNHCIGAKVIRDFIRRERTAAALRGDVMVKYHNNIIQLNGLNLI